MEHIMKKPLKIALITIGILFVIYNILGQTGVFVVYDNSTTSNEPNLKINSKTLVSNLIEPKIGDFICYKFQDELLGKHIRIHRLCGIENDTVEIKNGILYLNGENIDKETDFIHYYKLSMKEYDKIKDSDKITENSFASRIDENKMMILLEDRFSQSNGLESKRMVEPKNKSNKFINEVYNKNWNKDNFGPLVIPNNKVFVLGDNRDNSEDSRWIGFIEKSDIVGVVLSK